MWDNLITKKLSEIRKLVNLEILDLSFNKMTETPPEMIELLEWIRYNKSNRKYKWDDISKMNKPRLL